MTPSKRATHDRKPTRSLKRTLIGKVVSDKRAKTVTVLVERRVKHELYGKIVAKSSKYHAHDEKGEYKHGRRDRDHREPADLEDQDLGRDPPGREGRSWSDPALAATRLIRNGPQCGPFFILRRHT